MIFSHESPEFADNPRYNKNNGAYWYSVEIAKYFIPSIKTDRNWVTLGYQDKCFNHSIFFAHSNLYPKIYRYLEPFDDLIMVCSWHQQMAARSQALQLVQDACSRCACGQAPSSQAWC